MSAIKIRDLLNRGTMIDVSLMSDELKKILTEFCEIMSDHGEELKFLRNEIKKFSPKDESSKAIESIKEEIKRLTEQTLKNTQNDRILNDNFGKMMINMERKLAREVKECKDDLLLEMNNKTQEVDGKYIILNQQFKNINVKTETVITKEIAGIKNDIKRINSIIEKKKDQSLELLSQKIDGLEKQFKEKVNEIKEKDDKIDKEIESVRSFAKQYNQDFMDELHYLNGELKELKRLVAEAPQLDIDGQVDTETLVHAIQRDSRRIDNFNEIIVSVRDQNDRISALCKSLAKSFEELQLQIHDFEVEHNSTKMSLINQIDQSFVNTEIIRKDFARVESNIEDVVGNSLRSISSISSTFETLITFLSKITTRPLPKFAQFDDEVLEFQTLFDTVMTQKEYKETTDYISLCLLNKDHINRPVGEFLTSDEIQQLKTPFQTPFIGIPTLDSFATKKDTQIRKKSIFDFNNMHGAEPVVVTKEVKPKTQISDLEMKHSILELQRTIANLKEQMEIVRNAYDTSIANKADTQSVERMLDKVRAINSKLQSSINQMQNNMVNYVLKSEIETLLTNSSKQINQPTNNNNSNSNNNYSSNTDNFGNNMNTNDNFAYNGNNQGNTNNNQGNFLTNENESPISYTTFAEKAGRIKNLMSDGKSSLSTVPIKKALPNLGTSASLRVNSQAYHAIYGYSSQRNNHYVHQRRAHSPI
ncbi:hypothetical protein TRFO_30114 [Tritrichomonas foetus]|uniref:Uncharacterized protein n=1 Tax=Tritrichomonas foetus TaxID=1144522 RepID=A0A1J4JYY3_9EUKA|nr:hypothetical protein TRFO_30114 [Tritrichomonas foetus]|eukprot:OHT02710.1 hypothetical protein TRFO_30114 [Tritrichomonas foetus]